MAMVAQKRESTSRRGLLYVDIVEMLNFMLCIFYQLKKKKKKKKHVDQQSLLSGVSQHAARLPSGPPPWPA